MRLTVSLARTHRFSTREHSLDIYRGYNDYDGLVFVSHYENNSLPLNSSSSCLASGITRFLNLYCYHSIRVLHAEECLYPEQLEYHLDTSKKDAIHRLGEDLSPYISIVSENGPQLVCKDTGIPTPKNPEESEDNTCSFQCPCHKGKNNCYAFGEASCSLLKKPSGKLLYVHLIRRPIDILSDVYEVQISKRERRRTSNDATVGPLMDYLLHVGADNGTLKSLGALEENVRKTGYVEFLRKLPEFRGLHMELVRIGPDLWRMARVYQKLVQSAAMVIKRGKKIRRDMTLDPLAANLNAPDLVILHYEDLVKDLAKTIAPVLQLLRSPCLRGLLERDLVHYLQKTCGSKLSEEEERDHAARLQRRERLLMENWNMRDEIQRIQEVLDSST